MRSEWILRKMTGIEFMLNEVMEPNLFVIRKQKRDGPEKVTPMLTYYVLDGSIYQAPQLCNVFAARVVCAFFFIYVFFSRINRDECVNYMVVAGSCSVLHIEGFYHRCLEGREDWIRYPNRDLLPFQITYSFFI